MQENLFPQINNDMRTFNIALDNKVAALESEIVYLKKLRQLVHNALMRDSVDYAASSEPENIAPTTPPYSDVRKPITTAIPVDEIDDEIRRIARKLAPEKPQ